MKLKIYIPISITAIAILLFAGIFANAAQSSATFKLTVTRNSSDRTIYDGAVLDNQVRLSSNVGGIKTIYIFNGTDIFMLTPAIKTATKIPSKDIPLVTGSEWQDWVSEPARINPLTFAGILKLSGDFSGTKQFGADNSLKADFENGILKTLTFKDSETNSPVTYSWTEINTESLPKAADFQIPDDYMVTE